MKKYTPIIAATAISGLIITGLFATGILQYKENVAPKKTITLDQVTKDTSSKPDSLTYLQHMQQGDDYAKKNMTTLAINEYIAANQQQTENAEPYLKIGRLLLAEKNYTKAQEIYQQLLMKEKDNQEANLYLVKTYIMLRNIEKARDLLQTLPESQTKLYYTGIIAAYFGQYDAAKASLNAASTIVGGSPDIISKAKNVLSVFDEYGTNQGSPEIFLKTLLAKSFNQVGEYTLTIPLLFNVVKEKKDYRDAWILLGYAYLNTDDNKNAIDALEEAKKLDKNKPETLFFLGLSYSANNQKDLAAQYIAEAIDKGFEPKIQAQQKLAEIYMELKDYEKAALRYEAVVALNDTNINYYVRPMWLYIEKLNRPEKALALAKKAIEKHPNSGMAYNLVGWAQINLKDYDQAKQFLTKAVELDPSLAAAYLNLGTLHEKLANIDVAKEYYRTAFRLGEGSSIGDSAADSYNRLIALKNPTPVISTLGQANVLQPLSTAPAITPMSKPASLSPSDFVPKFKLPENENTPVLTPKLQPLNTTP